MFNLFTRSGEKTDLALINAINASQCVIAFDTNRRVIEVNDLFLQATGYRREEVLGQPHMLFMDKEEANGSAYATFWRRLLAGEPMGGEFRRLGRDGREIWIQATYTPVKDASGQVTRIVKLASDITAQKQRAIDVAGQLQSLNRSQAVITFNLDGTILDANDNFLSAVGYARQEIVGRHHRMFVAGSEREGADYRTFWSRLSKGEFFDGIFRRIAKDGREIYIRATYNPILDAHGRPVKVVKFATDITELRLDMADKSGQIEAINRSQAVIEFGLDGTVMRANANFLAVMGYREEEIKGRHHRLFMPAEDVDGQAYRDFWKGLASGEYRTGTFRRVAKDGHDVWINASYNAIFDPDGRPFKVVKYASDVTQNVLARKRSEHVGAMLESVAAGAEEMSSSVREIATSMVRSRDTAEAADHKAESATEATQRLASVTESVGGIVNVIADIAGQINLLALNATIESARAGEAGKGFAVVATEVKNLANQARAATERINAEIGDLRGASSEVVEALTSIRAAIDNVRQYVTSTAAAVEEQSAVAAEMSGSMQRAAKEAASIVG